MKQPLVDPPTKTIQFLVRSHKHDQGAEFTNFFLSSQFFDARAMSAGESSPSTKRYTGTKYLTLTNAFSSFTNQPKLICGVKLYHWKAQMKRPNLNFIYLI